jgi:hypothetical protein
MHCECELPQVVAAGHPPRRLAGTLYGRQEQADERADDGDHNEQFDQREPGSGRQRLARQRLAVVKSFHAGAKVQTLCRAARGAIRLFSSAADTYQAILSPRGERITG